MSCFKMHYLWYDLDKYVLDSDSPAIGNMVIIFGRTIEAIAFKVQNVNIILTQCWHFLLIKVRKLLWYLHNAAISSTFTGSLSGIMENLESHVSDLHQRRAVGVSSMKVIETALVADKQTLDYHGSYDNLVTYVLDIMNLVSTRPYVCYIMLHFMFIVHKSC